MIGELIRRATETGSVVAAFCPRCGGWTMFHARPTSDTAIEWMKMAYVCGDLVSAVSPTAQLGPACPQVDILLEERTCDA